MKNIIFLAFVLASSLTYSQESTHIKGKGYEGYIFPKERFVFMSIVDQKERYTPTKEEIVKIERMLIDSINYILNSQYHYKPSINKKTLKKYRRQYVGFLTKTDDIVIWINFVKNKDISKKELSEEIINVFDGGSNYWSVYINLTERKLFDMSVNGIS